jgi:2-dehydro-3-deoxygluconokinase
MRDTDSPPHVQITAAGESMALLLPPDPDRLRHARSLRLKAGGAESNVAIAASRLGLSSRWVTRLGDDELGRVVLAAVASEGVDVDGVVMAPGERTGLYLRDTAVGRTRVHYYRDRSAASRLAPKSIDEAELATTEVLHLTGITPALSPDAAAFIRWAIPCAREAGAAVSFDVNFRSKLWDAETARPQLETILAEADLVLVGDEEARALWGEDDTATVGERFASLGAGEIVVKHGARGASHWLDGQITSSDGFRVDEVDPVGAGDAFAAGYLAARAWGEDTQECLRVANAMGAICVMTLGDYEGLPDRRELSNFLDGTKELGR